ncbi:transcriptional regulator [Betaproteobacteria bacterium]|nr:transcriptional regulator [Betaproteobacteria bacterium]
MAKLLIVDDEIGIRELLSEILRDEGHDVQLAENAAAARAARNATTPDMVLLDIWMPDTDGITLLKEWSAAGQLTMPVVMMSGHGTIDTAVEATRIGAIDYLEKPIALQKLLATVKSGLQRRLAPVTPLLTLNAFPESAALATLHQQLRQAALHSRVIVLEVSADHLAELAARSLQVAGSPWLDLGALTGAIDTALLPTRQGGVLFIAAVEKLTRTQQKNLNFALDRLERYDLRLIAASRASREELAASGWDNALLERLFAIPPLIPPALGALRAELPLFATRILRHLIITKEVPAREFAPETLDQLSAQDWPNGYSELYATIRKLALEASGDEIVFPDANPPPLRQLPEVAPVASPVSLELPLREAREAFERMYFEHHLRLEGGNMTRLAQKTGLERTHLYRKLKQLGLHGGRRQSDDSESDA